MTETMGVWVVEIEGSLHALFDSEDNARKDMQIHLDEGCQVEIQQWAVNSTVPCEEWVPA